MSDGMDKKRYLLAWLDSDELISQRNITPVRRAIEDRVDVPREQVEIDVWIESPGGDANAAYKLALMLRHAASYVRVVVPDYAKSAATLLALCGDEIYLAPGSELGPLDAQMPEEGSYSGSISALNIARAADEVAREALGMAVAGGADLLVITGLSRAQTLDAVLKFSAEFSKPLVRQLDPKLVHHAKQMLLVTARYAEHLLTMTNCQQAAEIAQRLVEDFPTHGYVIACDEADRLGLPVRALADYELLDSVRPIHRAAEDGQSVIEFGPIEELLGLDSGDDDDEDDDTQQNAGDGGEPKHEQQPARHDPVSAGSGRDGAEAIGPDGPNAS